MPARVSSALNKRCTRTTSYDTLFLESTTVLAEVHENRDVRFVFPLEPDFAVIPACLVAQPSGMTLADV
jgi:hypothetical protein